MHGYRLYNKRWRRKKKVEIMRVGDKMDSNHHPVEVWLKWERGREKGKAGKKM